MQKISFKAMTLALFTWSSAIFASANMNKMHVSINRIIAMCNGLHEQMGKDGFEPDLLVGIARGGLIPLGFLASEQNFNNRNTRTINLQSYTDEGKKTELHLTNPMRAEDFPGYTILIIDDIADSGESLEFAIETLKVLCPQAIIKTAVLFYKKDSKIKPDYFITETDKWIVFPWEA